MSQAFTTANLQTLLAFPFRDTEWKKKFLVGSLVTIGSFIIPFVPFAFVYGYQFQIMRRIIVEKGEPFLPEWQDWNKLLLDGFKLLGVVMVFMLPILILFFGGYGLALVVPILGGFFAAMSEQTGGTPDFMLTSMGLVSAGGMFACYGLALLLAVPVGVVMPAILGHVVATDQFSAAFRLREWWAIFRANLGGFLLAFVLMMALSLVLSSVFTVLYCTIILCCLVPVVMGPMTMYLLTIYGALFGQVYRDGVEKLAGQGVPLG